MSTNFQVIFEKSNGNLHVSPSGDFDGNSAWELVNLLHEQYNGTGQVFIDTKNLCEICPFGCTTFQCRLNQTRIPMDQLFFSGTKGYSIAPEGSKVIVAHKKDQCRCNGDCANCSCSGKGKPS